MPSDDDDSSLQFQKLLPTTTTSSLPSPNKTVNSSSNRDDPKNTSACEDDLSFSFSKEVSWSSPKALRHGTSTNNPEDCYRWLLHGRDRKISEGALSSDTSASSSSTSSSSSSSSDSSFLSPPLPPPPDGGWGWMVVFGAFIVLLICDGLAYCFGVIYYELLVQFGESRSKTSLVGSLFYGVSMSLGPLASALTTRFGCRKVTIFGGILSFIGLILCHFATSIGMLYFTFSIVVGIGFSMCYVTSAVVVHFYFDKRRSLATGLSVFGTGVGTFTFAPFMEFLISEYGLGGMFLIMAAISLNLVVAGMLFVPLKFTEEERWQHYLAEFEKLPHGMEDLELGRLRYASESTELSSEGDAIDEDCRTMSMLSLPTFISEKKQIEPSSDILREALKNSKNPHLTYMRYMKNAYLRSNRDDRKDENTMDLGKDKTVTISSDLAQLVSSSNTLSEDIHQSTKAINKNVLDGIQPQIVVHKAKNTKISSDTKLLPLTEDVRKSTSFLNISNAFKSQSLSRLVPGMYLGKHTAMGMQLLLYRTDIFYRRHLDRPIPDNRPCLLGTSCPELEASSLEVEPKGWFRRFVKTLKSEASEIILSMIDFSLFRNVFFTVFTVSNFVFYFWSDIPYMFASDHSVAQGISTEMASFLLSIIGILNAIGQLFFGVIGDMKCDLISIYAIAMILSGVFVCLVPLMKAYWSMALINAIFGFFVSVNYPFVPVLLVNYLGVEHLTNAYGLLMLMQGIANVLGPPFAGWISDETKSYNAAFYLSGLFFAASGVIMFIVLIPGCRVQKVSSDHDTEKEIPNHNDV